MIVLISMFIVEPKRPEVEPPPKFKVKIVGSKRIITIESPRKNEKPKEEAKEILESGNQAASDSPKPIGSTYKVLPPIPSPGSNEVNVGKSNSSAFKPGQNKVIEKLKEYIKPHDGKKYELFASNIHDMDRMQKGSLSKAQVEYVVQKSELEIPDSMVDEWCQHSERKSDWVDLKLFLDLGREALTRAEKQAAASDPVYSGGSHPSPNTQTGKNESDSKFQAEEWKGNFNNLAKALSSSETDAPGFLAVEDATHLTNMYNVNYSLGIPEQIVRESIATSIYPNTQLLHIDTYIRKLLENMFLKYS